jgi:hypothetical protein
MEIMILVYHSPGLISTIFAFSIFPASIKAIYFMPETV